MIYKKLKLEGKQKVWFTSDTHAYHKNICRGTTTWDLRGSDIHSSTRDFDNEAQMTNHLASQINSYVDENDYLVHLGDFSFGGIDKIWKFRKQINCKNIILVLGNHDDYIANNRELENWTKESDRRQYAQQCFESVHSYLELTVSSSQYGKTTYNLFHFPILQWNKAHHDRVHLFGHVHGSNPGVGRSLDVGIDSAFKLFGEYRPFSQQDIIDYMENKEFVQQSHHNRNTN